MGKIAKLMLSTALLAICVSPAISAEMMDTDLIIDAIRHNDVKTAKVTFMQERNSGRYLSNGGSNISDAYRKNDPCIVSGSISAIFDDRCFVNNKNHNMETVTYCIMLPKAVCDGLVNGDAITVGSKYIETTYEAITRRPIRVYKGVCMLYDNRFGPF